MRKILLTLLLCFGYFVTFSQYTTYSGKCSIDFPKIPKEKIDKNNIVTLMIFDDRNVFYALLWTNTPVKFEKGKTSDLLDLTKKGFLEGYGGLVKKETNFTKDGWSGKDLVIVKDIEGQDVYLHYRIIFYSDRMYQIMYMSPYGEDASGSSKFFKSFKYLQ